MDLSESSLWRPFGRLVVSLFSLMLFFSCGRKDFRNKGNNPLGSDFSHSNKKFTAAEVFEAKNSDILIPLGFKACDFDSLASNKLYKNYSDFIHYIGSLSIPNIIKFYLKNMEREGWAISNMSNDYEGLLLCNKPNKCCVISVRKDIRDVGKNHIYLFVKNSFCKKQNKNKDINSKEIVLSKIFGDSGIYDGFKEG